MRVLIIGNNGYIGSLLTDVMSEECHVVGVDLCLFGPNRGKSLLVDMCSLTEDFISGFDVIVCLAAHSSVPLAKIDARGATYNNVVNLERIMNMLGPDQRLIYASSASVYGSGKIDAREDDESYQMLNSYDATKQIADDIAKSHMRAGKRIVGLRFGTVCGTSPNTRTDLAINNMMLDAHRQGGFNLSNEHIHRSWLSVDDAVGAIMHVARSAVWHSGIYNVKSFDSTMGGIADGIRDITGMAYDLRPRTPNAYDFTINIGSLWRDYGWRPKVNLVNLMENTYANIGGVAVCRRDDFGDLYRYEPFSIDQMRGMR